MKAYKDPDGKIRLFRPDMNLKRLNYSMSRMAMPTVDEGFIECLKQLLRLDESWIPDKEGYSIYIRPTGIGTSAYLGTFFPTLHMRNIHNSVDIHLFTKFRYRSASN
jgi:branched-chain amino acid aminotransferase